MMNNFNAAGRGSPLACTRADRTRMREIAKAIYDNPSLLEEFERNPNAVAFAINGFKVPDGVHIHIDDGHNKLTPAEQVTALSNGREENWDRVEVRIGYKTVSFVVVEDQLLRANAELAAIAALGGETTIHETARLFNVTMRTLRFYEASGLIRPRRIRNTRFFSASDRARLGMIVKGKRLAFSLAEIAELIGPPDPNCAIGPDFESRLTAYELRTRLIRLEQQRREIDEAIVRLRRTH